MRLTTVDTPGANPLLIDLQVQAIGKLALDSMRCCRSRLCLHIIPHSSVSGIRGSSATSQTHHQVNTLFGGDVGGQILAL